jgi:multidrug resistance protein MdtO
MTGGDHRGTLATVMSLLFFMVDMSEPALRIPLMEVSVFVGMILTRTSMLDSISSLS